MVGESSDTTGIVYFNHGRDSHPWTTKIQRLAEVARSRSFVVESLDYCGISDADRRAEILLESAKTDMRPLILVGSSMGGYVATIASEKLKPQGLFLMAPALYMEDYAIDDPHPCAETIFIVHGWRDEIIPVEHSIRFAHKFHVQLHLVDGDHRLLDQLETIVWLFIWFLDRFVSTPDKGQA